MPADEVAYAAVHVLTHVPCSWAQSTRLAPVLNMRMSVGYVVTLWAVRRESGTRTAQKFIGSSACIIRMGLQLPPDLC
jgi:hypothetical protein